ncbi:efflux RND transporter periplasmic adaptor subunit [Candidatus Fermentibacteria bacterium]|nr:efflux RND transporter periplasmic adaptor subunit [Candidatus Fermentibacteria bacterium]
MRNGGLHPAGAGRSSGPYSTHYPQEEDKLRPLSPYVSVVLMAILLAGACGEGEEPESQTMEPSPLPVAAAEARVDTLLEVIESTGRVSSARTQELTAQIQGEVVQAPLREGTQVEEGNVVFRIASGEQAAALSEARSAYRSAQALFEFECEHYQGELTEEVRRMLRRTTGLEDASAALSRAQTQYSNAAVRASFDGVVSELVAKEGVVVYPGGRLGTIVDPNNLEVTVDLDERQLSKCNLGQRVFLTIPSLGDTTLTGSVASVAPVVDPTLRAGRVVVELPGIPNLRPGATAHVEIVIGIHPRELVIPEEAVLVRDQRDMVFVVKEGKADWRYVTLGPSGRGMVAVEEGLEEGEQVITSGHYSLAHDAPVAVVE